jgi:hypothetical protein
VFLLQDETGISWLHFAIEPSNVAVVREGKDLATTLEFNGIVTDR